MGKDSGSAPQAPDPAKVIGLQSAANQTAFNQQTAAARFNTIGPDSSQSWSSTPQFDQGAYQQALDAWNQKNSQGTFVPGTQGGVGPAFQGGADTPVDNGGGATPGYWSGATSDGSAMPTKDQFTTKQWSLTNTLTPDQQKIHDLTQGANVDQAGLLQALTEKLGGTLNSPVDFSGAPGLNSGANLNPTQFNQNASDAAYRSQTRYLDPQVQQQQRELESRLGEQGFVPGTPAYQQAMQNFQDTNNRAYGQARDSATTQGFNVGHTQFGDALAQAGFGNTARTQAITEYLQKRALPLQEASQVRSMLPGGGSTASQTNVPQGAAAQLANTDVYNPYTQQYQGQLAGYNAGVQSNNATTGAVGSIAAAIAIAV